MINYRDMKGILPTFTIALIMFGCSYFGYDNTAVVSVMFFVVALTMINNIDKLVVLVLCFSTLPDFFSGAYPAVISIYSVTAGVIAISLILKGKALIRGHKNYLFFIFMIGIAYISYKGSEFHYQQGFYSLAYTLLLSIIVMSFVKISKDTLIDYFAIVAILFISFYFVVSIANQSLFSGQLVIRDTINHNGFGRSIAQMGAIIGAKVLYDKDAGVIYKIYLFLSILLTLFSGSRNAFLALIVSLFCTFVMVCRINNEGISKLVKAVGILLLIVFILNLFLPEVNFDFSRFNYIDLISSGGTNRATLWKLLIPVIIANYFWVGYGPGSFCSSEIVSPLVGRHYTHTHNTFIEAWGELGILGLISFVIIVIGAVRKLLSRIKTKHEYIVLFALVVDVLVNSIGESMFTGLNFWIIIAMCYAEPISNGE